MGRPTNDDAAVFEVLAQTLVAASPEHVYEVVSDLPRCGDWSMECTGGTWVAGVPATVGAVFRGHNLRGGDVVAWAPVVRGAWTTDAEVVVAEPGRRFHWTIRDSLGHAQASVWAYDIEPAPGGSTLIHHFRMDTPTEGIRKITSGMGDVEWARFRAEWTAKLQADMTNTVGRVRNVVEKD